MSRDRNDDSRKDNRGGNKGGNVQVTVGITAKNDKGFTLKAFVRKGGAVVGDQPVVFSRNGEPEVGGVVMTSRIDGSATWEYKFPGGFNEGVTATVEVAGAAPKLVSVNPLSESSETSSSKAVTIPKIVIEETVLSLQQVAEGRYSGTICVFNEDTGVSMPVSLTFRSGEVVTYQSFGSPAKFGVRTWKDSVGSDGVLCFDIVVTGPTQIDIFVDGFAVRKLELNIPFEGVQAQEVQRGFGRGWR